ncbi:MAG: type II toxin-antitoxin system RelE/ParE family toxin, partial [Gemmatimonadales bacterium]
MVHTSDEFDHWWATCDSSLQDTIAAYVGLLEAVGPQLGRPYADTLRGSSVRNLKELRVQH